jgi:hypothetical protein
MKLHRNFSQWTHPIHSIGPTTHVLGRFGPFRYCKKSWCKTGRTCTNNAQVCWTKLRWNLSQRTLLIHSIGPKTHVFGRFRPFRYLTKVDAKLAELVPLTHKFAKQSRVRIFHNERPRSTPLDPKLMFRVFRTISLLHKSRCKTSQTSAINVKVR